MKLDDFIGDWRIERRIDDRHAARTGTLTGTARFFPDRDGLRYTEDGVLRWPGQPGLTACQSYLWRADGAGIAVMFADGRAFHRFALGAADCSAVHDCPPDRYMVHYDLARWPDWSAIWRVSGPRKDYMMTTRYVRDKR